MIIVTGGAGFIGSVLVWYLNKRGREDIIIVDDVNHPEKQRNISPLKYEAAIGIEDFLANLAAGKYTANLEAIVHLGAISSTTEQDWDRFKKYNIDYTKTIIAWCAEHKVRCVYASSGATYGAGEHGYSDDPALFDRLKPLNLYGQSKLQVDVWARDQGYLKQAVGLRYFNVFGPNENHKGEMRSVIAKKFQEVKKTGTVELFKSYHRDYADGESKRDFVYVMDAVDVTTFFLNPQIPGGVYNVGTGKARSWNDLARALFKALDVKPRIAYVDMPAELRDQYQYFTQANLARLRATGYSKSMTTLEAAVDDYVKNYLLPDRHLH